MARHPPKSVAGLDDFGRIRLSEHFFMRDFLYSEIGAIHGMANIPDDPDLAIESGRHLCETLLEPLQAQFGPLALRSGFRSQEINAFGNRAQRKGKSGYSCATNEHSYGHHIWDRRDRNGHMGATVSLVVPSFLNLFEKGVSWTELAWWIHDHLPYSSMFFFPKNAAFNLRWCEQPERRIDSYVAPRGCLTKPGMAGHDGDHSREYQNLTLILKG